MSTKKLTRRNFISSASAALASLALAQPGKTNAAQPNEKINLAMIGCGKRGHWIAEHFHNHGGYNIIAAADYFQDRLDSFGQKYNVPQQNRFTGFSCYQKVLEIENLDAVAILSPPYFHPEQTAAAIDAGKHVFLAKPIAVDVPGCKSIAQSGEKATQNNLCLLVDFQTRVDPFYQQAVKKVHYGDIGPIASGLANYYTARLELRAKPGTPEAKLKNWVFDKALSGDIIIEQNIHAIDVASWVMADEPLYAIGSGSRKIRTDVGDCWDNFSVIFNYPQNVTINFNSKQFGFGCEKIECIMFGSEGTLFTEYGKDVKIAGNIPYKGGQTSGIYTTGAVTNIKNFYDNITKSRFYNPTVAESVTSHLAAILGRTAAYRQDKVTFQQIMDENEKLVADLTGLND